MTDSGPQDIGLRFARIDAQYRTIRTAIRTAGWLVAAYLFYKTIGVVAGQTTTVSVAVSVILTALVDLKFALAVSLAGAFGVWAIAERMLRHRAVGRLGTRNAAHERTIHPSRTSSGLTSDGRTNPSDRGRKA
jgi:hypothetical protein